METNRIPPLLMQLCRLIYYYALQKKPEGLLNHPLTTGTVKPCMLIGKQLNIAPCSGIFILAPWAGAMIIGRACFIRMAPRGLTHAKCLYAPEQWIDCINLCWHELGATRAVLLVQLSPAFAPDYERLQFF